MAGKPYDFSGSIIESLLTYIGEDPKRGGLVETPARVLAAWEFWSSGYGREPKDVLKTFTDGAEKADEMVYQGGIPFYSHCEHHLAPFFGYAHLAYIPNGKIVGLSKLARLTEIFARRLQVQERMGAQIADALADNLGAHGVGVVLQARHLCMESRGIQKTGTVTITSSLRGTFKDQPEVRSEFMSFVQATMAGIKTL
jgi:GTP cyclohydrolase IA